MGFQLSACSMSTSGSLVIVKFGLLILLAMAIVSPQMSTMACLSGNNNNNNNNNNNKGGDGGGDGGEDGGDGDGCNNNNNNNNNRNCNNNNNNNNNRRVDDEGEADLEIEAFKICDTNKDGSLTWQEVEVCEENYCNFLNF